MNSAPGAARRFGATAILPSLKDGFKAPSSLGESHQMLSSGSCLLNGET